MPRVNLTLDTGTFEQLQRHARQVGKPYARVVTEVLREGLARREAVERRRRLARDYAADRADAGALLRDLEGAQGELMGHEED